MGATNFIHTVEAKTAYEGFNLLVAEANQVYGRGSYTGSINTCTLGRCTKSYGKNFKEEYAEQAQEFIRNDGYGRKWESDYIDLGKLPNGNNLYMFYGWASE